MRRVDARDESGAILILALFFLTATLLIMLALGSWTTNNLDNTASFQSAGAKLYAAQGATQVAMRAARYTYEPSGGQICPGASTQGINGVFVQDWCAVTPFVSPTITRQVTLSACLMPTASATLTGACQANGATVPTLLTAVVDFDDNPSSNPAVPNCTSTANQSTCGNNMTVVSWKTQ